MTSRFEFSLATEADDGELRARMAEGVMEGDIAITFRREPSYFRATRVFGDQAQVIKCVDRQTRKIIGHGCRSTLQAYVDQTPARIGYLSDLRSIAQYRGGTLLARGYKYLRELHDSDPVPFYITVLYDGNVQAEQNLLGGRAGLPTYSDLGRLLTPAVHLDFPRRPIHIPGITIERANSSQLPAIVAFLNKWQQKKQLAPVYRESDFPGGRFAGLRAEDFIIALDRCEIVGTIAAWDQNDLRQTHVERYSRRLSLVRPGYNFIARFTPLKSLPAAGSHIPFLYFSCMCAREHNVNIFRALFRAMYNALRRGPWHYAIVGLHESDSYAKVLEDYRRIEAAGRIFAAHYADSNLLVEQLRARPIYLEAACI